MILEIGNTQFTGFKSVSVTSSMDTLTDSFSITAHNRWSGTSDLQVNQEAKIYLGEDDKIMSGYIGSIGADLESNISISGFDKTFDLAGSTINGSGEFVGLDIKQICEQICEPFDISVSGEDGETINRFRYGLNEACSDVIKRLVVRQGYLAYSDIDGNLVIGKLTDSERASIALQEGVNMINPSSVSASGESLRSTYRVLGQNYDNQFVSSEFEGNQSRYRPQTFIDNGDIQIADSDSSSEWIGQFNEGNAVSYVVTVRDIQNEKPNTLIDVKSNALGVDGTLLIRSIKWTVDDSGSKTTFFLSSPYVFGGKNIANNYLK